MLIALLATASADDAPVFDTDVSAGVLAGTVLGEWPVPGLGLGWQGRYDAFVGSDEPGARVGLSIFAAGSALLLQDREEVLADGSVETEAFDWVHYGALALIRYDPQAPWGGTFGLGFSRFDLDDYYEGPHAVPMLTMEGGARRALGKQKRFFLDLGVRTCWGQDRSALEPEWTDWWTVWGSAALGAHL